MPKLTKAQFEAHFREEILPYVIERYEQDGIPDKPARREAWNDTVDAYIRDRQLPEAAGNWSHPRWLETWRPRGAVHARMKKTQAQRLREQRDRERGGRLDAALATTLEKRRADPYNIASWETGPKKPPAQLDREVAEILARTRTGHATKRASKTKSPRLAHVTATTPSGYRWLRQYVRGATITPEGFAVTDEAAWAESLRAAEAREI